MSGIARDALEDLYDSKCLDGLLIGYDTTGNDSIGFESAHGQMGKQG